MGFIYFPHGAIIKARSPVETGTSFAMSPILKPLEPFRSHLTIVSGLRNKGGESSDPHGIMAGTWLSCHGIKNREGDMGTTADQLAARHFAGNTPIPSLELTGEGGNATCGQGATGCGFGSTVAFRTPFQPLPMEDNPRKVFYQLFGQGDTSKERKAILSETDSLLDYVMEEGAALKKRIGAAARARQRLPDRCARWSSACSAWPPARARRWTCRTRRRACPTSSVITSTRCSTSSRWPGRPTRRRSPR
jgi:hypothetical protein